MLTTASKIHNFVIDSEWEQGRETNLSENEEEIVKMLETLSLVGLVIRVFESTGKYLKLRSLNLDTF